MKLNEIYALLDALAPKALSDEFCKTYGAYDNSGVLVDAGGEIDKALFSLDLSLAAVEEAKRAGAGLIVTHHPAVYSKIGGIRVSDFDPLGKKLAECLKHGISVVSMHLNLDAAPFGIDESLMEGILSSAQRAGAGLRPPKDVAAIDGETIDNETIACTAISVAAIYQPLSVGGYGRAYDVPPVSLKALAEGITDVFGAKRVAVYGDERTVKRAASFCGAGADEGALEFAAKNGADVVISADFKHHILALALETGLAVIQLTHYASENYGFENYYRKIRKQAGIPCVFHTDEALL